MKQIRPCSTWTRDSDDFLFNPQVSAKTIQSNLLNIFSQFEGEGFRYSSNWVVEEEKSDGKKI